MARRRGPRPHAQAQLSEPLCPVAERLRAHPGDGILCGRVGRNACGVRPGDRRNDDPAWAGIELLQAFEEISGVDPQKQKSDPPRWVAASARPEAGRADFSTMFRNSRAEMQVAGVGVSDGIAVWHLRSKLGLNESRLELLDTATGGQLGFDMVPTQATRLFKRIHLNERGADRPPFEGLFRSGRSEISEVLERAHPRKAQGALRWRSLGHRRTAEAASPWSRRVNSATWKRRSSAAMTTPGRSMTTIHEV